MDMHISVEIIDRVHPSIFGEIYDYFSYIDETFSPFKKNSEITKINEGKLTRQEYSKDMETVLSLCGQTKIQTDGFFDIHRHGKLLRSMGVSGDLVKTDFFPGFV